MALLRILLALGFLCGTAVPALAASPAVGSSADRDQGSGDRPEHPMAGGRGDQVPVGAYGRQVAPGFVETSYRDVGVTAILVPPAAADSGTVHVPTAVVGEFGHVPSVFPVTMRIGTTYSSTVVCTLAARQVDTVRFAPVWTARPLGTHSAVCYTALCGDVARSNDTARGTVEVVVPERHDVGAVAILYPAGTVDSGTVRPPLATVRNFGTRPESFAVTLTVGVGYSQTVQVSLAPGALDSVEFPSWAARPLGELDVACHTGLSTDEDRSNDSARGSVQVIVPACHDVGAVAVVAPAGTVDSGTSCTPRAAVANHGNRTEVFPVVFQVSNGYSQARLCTLAAGHTDTLAFSPDWWARPLGSHGTVCYTALVGDVNRSNDTARGTVDVVVPEFHDVGAVAILAPADSVDSGTVHAPRVVIRNFGTRNETFPTTMKVGAGYSQTVQVSLSPGTADSIDFPNWIARPLGEQEVTCFTSLSTDEDRSNDTAGGSVRVVAPACHDVGAIVVIAPAGTVDSGTACTPRAVVSNHGNRAEVFPATLQVATGYYQTRQCTLAVGQTETLAFSPDWWARPLGSYGTVCYTALVGDANRANDTARGTVEVVVPEHHNVGAVAILVPSGAADSGTVQVPQAVIMNSGTRNETFPVTMTIGAGYSQMVQRSLAPGESDTVSFPDWVAHPVGVHATFCYTALINDEDRSNDTASGAVVVNSLPCHDVGALLILAPSGVVDSGTACTPQAVVANHGNRTEIFPVTFEVGTGYSQTRPCTLAVGQTETLAFSPDWWARPLGSHSTVCYTALVGDANRANDTTCGQVTVVEPARHDVGVLAVLAPAGLQDSGTVHVPRAVVHNFGNRTDTFPVTFAIGVSYSQTLSRELASGRSDTVAFPDWTAQPVGGHTIACFTSLTTDADRSNDTAYGSVSVIPASRHDVGVLSILWPKDTVDSGCAGTPRAVVRNHGNRTETFPVGFMIGSGYSRSVGRTLAPGQADTVEFPVWLAGELGRLQTVCFTGLAADEDRTNDTVSGTVEVIVPEMHDVGAVAIVAPGDTVDSGVVVVPRAVVRNYGTRAEDFPVTLTIGGGYAETVACSLLRGQSDTVAFPGWCAGPLGSLAVVCHTGLGPDVVRANDTVRSTVAVRTAPRHDVGAVAILAPVDTVDSGAAVLPRAVVRNFGTRPETFPVEFGIGPGYRERADCSLVPGQTDTLSFPLWVAAPVGAARTVCLTDLAADEDRSNDTVGGQVVVVRAARHDVGVAAIVSPTDTVDSGTVVTPRAVVCNFGTRSERFPTTMNIGSAYSETVLVSLAPGESDSVRFPNWSARPTGNVPVVCVTGLAEDENRWNDTAEGEVTVVVPERHDVGAVAILSPAGTLDSGTVVTPRAVVRNFGTRSEEFPVTLRIGATYLETVGWSQGVGAIDTVVFPHWVAGAPESLVTLCYTGLDRDADRTNDSVRSWVRVVPRPRHDVGAVAILAPVGTLDSGTVHVPRAVVHNFGNNSEDFPVEFLIGGVYADSTRLTLAPGLSDTLQFRPWVAQPVGRFETRCRTGLVGDQNRSNDTVVGDDTVIVQPSPRHDVGVSAILAPVDTVDSGSVHTPRAVVGNYGNREELAPVTLRIGSSYAQSVQRRLVPGQVDTVIFPHWTAAQSGVQATVCHTSLADDCDRSNDTAQGRVSVRPGAVPDVGAVAILAPAGVVDSGVSVVPLVVVRHFSDLRPLLDITFPVRLTIGSGYEQTAEVTLPEHGIDTVAFPEWVAQRVGASVTTACTQLANDPNRSNDTARGGVDVLTPPRHDVGVATILAPAGTVGLGAAVRPGAVIANHGTRPATFPATMRIGAEYTSTVLLESVPVGWVDTVQFEQWYAGPVGSQPVVCYTVLVGDEDPGNDTATGAVRVTSSDVAAVEILEPVGTPELGTRVTPRARVRNNGPAAATFPVRMVVGTGYVGVTLVTVEPENDTTVEFPAWTAQPLGPADVVCCTELPGDPNPANDTVRGSVSVVENRDIGVEEVLAPVGRVTVGQAPWSTSVTPRARVVNYSEHAETDVQVRLRITQLRIQYPGPETVPVGVVCEQTAVLGSVLQPGASVEVAFPELSLAFGVYMVSCSTVQAADNNPANDRATGWFVVDNDIGARAVEVRIYNRAGEFIRSLAFAATVGSPSWVTWDGRNEQGRRVAPGTYLCLIAARALTDEPAEERCCPVLVTRDANEVRLRWRQQ